MCGIVAYTGKRQAVDILMDGLRKLEYRGYDSAGISVIDGNQMHTLKKKGKIDDGLAPVMRQVSNF